MKKIGREVLFLTAGGGEAPKGGGGVYQTI